MGKKVFLVDTRICNGCYSCHIGCKDENVTNDWTPIAKPQPEIGQFWLKLHEKIRGTVPKVKVAYRPGLCMHCDNPTCKEACPIEGAIYKRDDGLVIIDPIKCTGCRKCLEACPYEDVIYFNEDLNIAQKCTGCAHLIDAGWKETRCSDNCPTLAIRIVDEDSDEAKAFIAEAEFYKPEIADKMKPRVYYKGLPKKFIAGTIYDPVEDEVIIGGDLKLTCEDGKTYTLKSDHFGDFWFENLPDGRYTLEINANGKTKVFEDLNTACADINLGDIAM
ncbi:MAG: 4Fe-4S dicluster domain-containing protein [Clostridiales bacterium]|jgi:Fe-S-cluster-containing dehydrogenase component|nr:4Fe-4S dicluster domain-containing protein [Clostridiales bacterium]